MKSWYDIGCEWMIVINSAVVASWLASQMSKDIKDINWYFVAINAGLQGWFKLMYFSL